MWAICQLRKKEILRQQCGSTTPNFVVRGNGAKTFMCRKLEMLIEDDYADFLVACSRVSYLNRYIDIFKMSEKW